MEERSLCPAGTTLQRVTTQYFDVYDRAGNSRVVTTIHGGANAPSIVSFAMHDRYGRVTQEGVQGGLVTAYTYDRLSRVITERLISLSWSGQFLVHTYAYNTFTHNIFGVTSVRNIEGNTAYTHYDRLGRVTRTSDFMGNYTRFYYDVLDRVVRQYTPFERDGTVVYYAQTRLFSDLNGNLLRSESLVNRPGEAEEWAGTRKAISKNLTILRSVARNAE